MESAAGAGGSAAARALGAAGGREAGRGAASRRGSRTARILLLSLISPFGLKVVVTMRREPDYR